ncbi:golvesin C-terminal-like domain-containing protein [Streptomyces barringtoniae]|uniref:golvesin C-terminal-like domain-containing protein n=1 Tax=Streptomyces barringtoniae TaxID=2892029 RepID=UPI001E57D7E0|nr:Tat pathway signal protein [Streptomyces barringtoniae]MCC5480642.1 Tat pathway signal protein [Streptomyces barringtoniae]
MDPDKKLGKGWNTSKDRAVTAAADSDGLRILVADSAKAYDWKTVASLSEPGMPADSWIGNQCVIDHDHAAVVYAPRTFTNKPDLMQGGAFTAIVNLTSGQVTKLPFTASLAYFDPSCNPETHTAAFTAFRDMNDPSATRTRVVTVNTAGKTLRKSATKGEVTSAVPVKDGAIGALGRHLVRLDRQGKVEDLLTAGGVPFDIHPVKGGKVAFVERDGSKRARARLWSANGKAAVVAGGKLGDLDLARGGSAQVFLVGHPYGAAQTQGSGITRINAPVDTDVSSLGRLAVNPVLTPGLRAGVDRIENAGKGFTKTEPASQHTTAAPGMLKATPPMTVTSTATGTGEKLSQQVTPALPATAGNGLSPALASVHKARAAAGAGSGRHPQPARTAAAIVSHDPTDPDRWCSVSRNDVGAQALQPTPNQVEWAVDMAIRGDLHASYLRQGGYRNQTGMSTIDPQGLFKVPTLTGPKDARIPANVMLGIMAQESNLWQAESGSIPGQMGNPLAAVDGYYGHQIDPGNPDSYWNINWDKSDCGYGVGQVTDGMRLKGHEKPGETSLSPALQKAVAIDYATNIAASLKILADKWNEVHTDGQKITVNDDDPSYVENWFTAVWNYNLGFNPPSDASKHGGHWGLGWYNNPANPLYKKSWGHPFMDTDVDGTEANHDAAHPQDWPYEEKVMGWAAWSIDTGYSYATDGRQDWPGESGFSSAGFRPAWWNTTAARSQVSPPLSTFCNSDNNCDPATPPNCGTEECYAQFWFNKPNATWKTSCATACGHELIKYQSLIPEPGRGYRLKNGTPVCSGAPTGAQVVASVPNGTETWSDCGQTTSSGSFQFTFYADTMGTHFNAKADLHQVGGGYGGHFWYAHARDGDHLGGDEGSMTILGDWKLNSAISGGGAKVYAHVPDTGAQVSNATYKIITPFGTVTQTIDQGAHESNQWVSLGAYNFKDQAPEVQLSNFTANGTADKDVAWGAVAFVPGDFSGMPKINFPAENPDAPDVDDVTAQKPEAAPAPTPEGLVAATGSNTRRATGAGGDANACSRSSHGVKLCVGPYQPWSKLPKSPAGKASPKSTHSPTAGSEPVPWCKTAPGSDFQYTRTQGCLRGGYALKATNSDGEVIGGGNVKVVQEILLNPTSQQFTTWTEFSLPDLVGVPSATLDTYFEDCWAMSDCTASPPGAWSGSTTWTQGDAHTASRTDTYSWNKVAGGEATLGLDWNTSWSAPGASATANNEWKDTAFSIRCDNKVGGNTGCVFPKVAPTMYLERDKYPAAAAYYYIMQEKLASHPGSKKYDKPLHRLADDAAAKANRDKMCMLAVAEWNPNPNAIGKSCDEYPFAKSRESGGMTLASGKSCVQMYAVKNTNGTYTLKLDENYAYPTWNEICGRAAITTSQNTAAGGKLGRFTTGVRLLDADAYYVNTGYESCDLSQICDIG